MSLPGLVAEFGPGLRMTLRSSDLRWVSLSVGRMRICYRFPGPMPLAAGQRETARRDRAAAAKTRITSAFGRPLKSRLRT